MKLPWDKKQLCWGITGFLTVAACIIFFILLQRWSAVVDALALISGSLRPITYGLVMAYLLNPLLNVIEHSIMLPLTKKICKKNHRAASSWARAISILFAWVIAALFVYALFSLIVPELYKSIESLIVIVPQFGNNLIESTGKLLKENPEILMFMEKFIAGFTTDVAEIMRRIQELIPNLNVMITGLTGGVYAVIKALLNILIGIIVSVYVLKDKEKFVAQIKRIFYSIMSTKKANITIAFFRLTHDKFGNFITGKIFDSLIIGVLCFVVLVILNMPYAALVSVIVGVTNLIPFFGPFIGAVPSAILILFADPIKCITFIIFIIILQQFDGNILGPKILGSTTGISSFWVMFSILVGSGLFGVWGMICAVPFCAVVFSLVRDGCHLALRKKGIDYSAETYENIDHIDEETNTPVWLG